VSTIQAGESTIRAGESTARWRVVAAYNGQVWPSSLFTEDGAG
jgi:hypothetical protein